MKSCLIRFFPESKSKIEEKFADKYIKVCPDVSVAQIQSCVLKGADLTTIFDIFTIREEKLGVIQGGKSDFYGL